MAREVEEDDLLESRRKGAGVEAPLLDLTEFVDTFHADLKVEPGGPKGHRVLKRKANLRVPLKIYGWTKLFSGGESIHRYGKAAKGAKARESWTTDLRKEKHFTDCARTKVTHPRSSRQSMTSIECFA